MATTPPPPTRVRTPPTPLHGPKYDTYEPYSPRRSSRISSRKDNHSFQENMGPFSEQASTSHSSSKSSSKKPTFKRTSSHIYSPPSSPISSPQQHVASPRRSRVADSRSDHDQRYQQPRGGDGDVDMLGYLKPRPSHSTGTHGMPTPTKTPKKRGLYDESKIRSASRMLFPPRTSANEDVMPSPRKARKNKHAAFSLLGEEEGADQVEIYTDSRERIPEQNEAEDNPFLSRGTARRAPQSPPRRTRNGTKHGMTKEVDEAVERGDGMVYVFRGKKFYRAFSTEPETANDNDEDELAATDDLALLRAAGPAARKRLLRKDIKPRLLFPPKDATPEPVPAHEDEEALTDIDPEPELKSSQQDVTTPTEQTFRFATPPTTVKKDRRVDVQEEMDAEVEREDYSRMWLDGAADAGPSTSSRGKGKETPFDQWQRTKPGVAKRAYEGVDGESVGVGVKGKKMRGAH